MSNLAVTERNSGSGFVVPTKMKAASVGFACLMQLFLLKLFH